jgi:hypothetical protein
VSNLGNGIVSNLGNGIVSNLGNGIVKNLHQSLRFAKDFFKIFFKKSGKPSSLRPAFIVAYSSTRMIGP